MLNLLILIRLCAKGFGNLKCALGFHSWEQVGKAHLIESPAKPFDLGGKLLGWHAMGRCSRCNHEALR